nr:hypothetical protein [Tanacetum cinerariifolium]
MLCLVILILRTSLGVPSNLDLWDLASLQPFNFTVHNFYQLLPKNEACHQSGVHLTERLMYKDAKTLFAAIQTRFGGNEATKKTQKTLLKQMYKNFSVSSTESLAFIFNRLQKIVSQLAILDTMSFDDIYNNFKIIKQTVKGTASLSSSLNSQNMAFVSSLGSTNEVNTTYRVSTTSTQANTTSTQVSIANLSDATLNVNVEETSSNAMVDIDGAVFDWSFMADDEVPTNMALMAFLDSEEFQQPKFEGYRPKTSKNVSGDIPNEVNESPAVPLVKELVLDDKFEKKTIFPTIAKIEFVRAKQQEKPVRKPVKYAKMYSKTVPNVFNVESSSNKPRKDMSKILRPDAPIIEDWTSNSEEETKIESVPKQKEPSFVPASKHVKTPRISVKSKSDMETLSFLFDVQGNPQQALKDKGVIDSGCSRHMNGNIYFLLDFEEFNRGYVAFRRNPKGGKISGKDTECVVLSFDYKLSEKNHVLLRVPREKNMYNVDLKNVVPSGDLTCLFAKATLDESNLWHRRLGYINFKTMNKLVKGNLVRGLPSKIFENNHTCVACKKGKQHRAFCKSKLVSSVNHPLQRLHMDFYGPTFVKSLNKKSYCLVVTNDYSRFSWVFFLATKDETSTILKTFITGIENQINHEVKIIRCDNRIEFKNHDFNQLSRIKGIKREFSVARTPQQNGVAERKNRTLIEAARTMLADSLIPSPFRLRQLILPAMYKISKAFSIFNSRTRIVQETLHINFLENKPNVAWFGPKWMFDIDTLTQSMNYQPVVVRNQPTNNVGIKENLDAGKVKKETVPAQQYVLLLLWSTGLQDPHNTDHDVTDAASDVKENENEVHVSPSRSDKTKKHDDKAKRDAKGKSPVGSPIGIRDLRAEFEEFTINSTNRVIAASTLVTTARPNPTNSTNSFNTASPFDTVVSLNFRIT